MEPNNGKHFFVLENNPEVMNRLAAKLGLSDDLTFYDIYSLDEEELAHIPRPAVALLVIIPLTPAWASSREAEDETVPLLDPGVGPVIWFKQTIPDACGSIGLLHCLLNSDAAKSIKPGSIADELRKAAQPLHMEERAQMLYDSQAFEEAHQSVAHQGDTEVPSLEAGHKLGQHFVAFTKAKDGHLWELEGSRPGPIDRGALEEYDDVLSPKALELGLKRIMNMEQAAGGRDLRFSCIALARNNTV